jgi:N-acetylhexosamine 1-kinase
MSWVHGVSRDSAATPDDVFAAARAFGQFARVMNLPSRAKVKETLRHFRNSPARIRALKQAAEKDPQHRRAECQVVLDELLALSPACVHLYEWGRYLNLPSRIVHNDTKINNLLFCNKKAVAVIDLDTVGPGILYYDYGDALRTSASTAAEDEQDLAKVDFNMQFFTAFTQGYMAQIKPLLSNDEAAFSYLAPSLMTFIMGIRFLADYLNGDVYYKTKHPRHNLDRSKVQKKLIESMENRESEMKALIEQALRDA